MIDKQTLAKAGQVVNPREFYDVAVIRSETYHYKPALPVTVFATDNTLVFLLCYVHRMALAGPNATPDYTNSLVDRAAEFIKGGPFYGTADELKVALQSAKSLSADLANHASFTALVCALDMFFVTFPAHPLAKMRMATLHMYCKDYTILGDIRHMQDISGLPARKWVQWVWVNEANAELAELVSIMKFCNIKESYFPYLRGFGELTKSPFAVGLSPTLHAFIHCFGSLKGDKRSQSARLLSVKAVEKTCWNARYLTEALGIAGKEEANPMYFETVAKQEAYYKNKRAAYEAREAAKRLATETGAATTHVTAPTAGRPPVAGSRPRNDDAVMWLTFAHSQPRGEDPEIIRKMKAYLDSIKEIRTGTVLEALKLDTDRVASVLDIA